LTKHWRDEDFVELGRDLPINGREINNLLRTGSATAKHKKVSLTNCMPRALYDEPGMYDTNKVICLLIAFQGCGSKICNHQAGCELGFAHGLLLHQSGEFGSFKRVGIAKTYQSDWVGVERTRIVIS
jgi:hypothetical protein